MANLFNYWFFIFGLTLPFQLAKHFWPEFSFVSGLRSDYLAPTLYLTDIVLSAFIFLNFNSIFFSIKNLFKKHRIFFLLLFLVLIFNFSISHFKWLFAYRLYQYLKILIVALIFSGINKKQLAFFLNGLFVSAILALVLSIFQIELGSSLQGWWYYLGERRFTLNSVGISTISIQGQKILRPYGFFSHPNSMAGFYLLVLNLGLIFKKGVLTLLSVLLIILSFSKFSIILLSLILWFYFGNTKSTCIVCKLSKFLLLIWLVFFTFLYSNNSQSLLIRLNSNLESINHVLDHAIGYGLGHYLSAITVPTFQPIHNVFFLLLFEMGILIWPFIAYFLVYFLKNKVAFKKYLPLLITILLIANFDHYLLTLNQNMLILGCVSGIIIGFLPKRHTLG